MAVGSSSAVLDLVNQAIEAGKAEEQFIPLPPCDQTISLVLVQPALYKTAAECRADSPESPAVEMSPVPNPALQRTGLRPAAELDR